MPFGQGVIR